MYNNGFLYVYCTCIYCTVYKAFNGGQGWDNRHPSSLNCVIFLSGCMVTTSISLRIGLLSYWDSILAFGNSKQQCLAGILTTAPMSLHSVSESNIENILLKLRSMKRRHCKIVINVPFPPKIKCMTVEILDPCDNSKNFQLTIFNFFKHWYRKEGMLYMF